MNRLSAMPKFVIILFLLLVEHHIAGATIYTAQLSGNYNVGTTWVGGTVPPYNLNNDAIVIPSGIIVTLTADLTVSNTLGAITVNGSLVGPTNSIDLSFTPILGTGTIDVDSLSGSTTGPLNFEGTLNVNKINLSFTGVTGSNPPTINVNNTLYGITYMNLDRGVINITNGATLWIEGQAGTPVKSQIEISGTGSINFTGNYNVIYPKGSVIAGVELSGSGLYDINIDPGSGNEIQLTADLNVNQGVLIMNSGILNLNSHNLNFTNSGDISPSGMASLKSSSASDITINKSMPVSGALRFVTGGNTVRKLTINTNGSILLESDLKITNTVDLQLGKLDVQNHKLSLITGATITGANSNKYIITGVGGALVNDIGSGASVKYDIGTENLYAPCIITSKNNTVYNGLGASVNDTVRTMGASGKILSGTQPLVNATWLLDRSSTTAVDIDLELMWDLSMEANSFNRNKSYITQLVGATWDKKPDQSAGSNGGLYSAKRTNISSLSSFAVFDAATVGINRLMAENTIRIYPNPAKNMLYVETKSDAVASVYNISGQQVSTANLSATKMINISSLAAGVYYIRFTGKDVNSTIKFVKE